VIEEKTAGSEATAAAQEQQEQDQAAGKARADANGKPIIAVKVYAPFQVFFEGDAYSVSGVNESGPFDILPRHYNFLCMLVPCDMVIKTPLGDKTVKIERAFMHVKAEKVTVFVDV
jgi:F0F1-type ATP synthase epsilon subunit